MAAASKSEISGAGTPQMGNFFHFFASIPSFLPGLLPYVFRYIFCCFAQFFLVLPVASFANLCYITTNHM